MISVTAAHAIMRGIYDAQVGYDLTHYQWAFRLYDRSHPEAPLGPEPTIEQLLTAVEVCRAENRILAEPLAEAARMVKS